MVDVHGAAPPVSAAASSESAPNVLGSTTERPTRFAISWVTAAAVLVTAALTAALSVLCYQLNRHNEHRLLELQVKQTATVLQTLLPAIETPLTSAGQLAAARPGASTSFQSYMSSYVGKPPKEFASASLWRVSGAGPQELSTIGPPSSSISPAARRALVAKARQGSLTVSGPLGVRAGRPRLAYAFAANGYVVYAESLLPPHRHAEIQRGSPFADLQFALYLGSSPKPGALLETSVDRLPVPGDTAMATVPFGNSALTLVASSDRALGGGLSGSLWWIVVIIGVVLAGLIAVTTEWLVRRRRQAEGRTAQTEVQLVQQRTLAQMIQHALLPESIPDPPGLAADARYIAGVAGVDIGGDWYDLIPLPDGRVFLVIGDVSGRGVQAGTTMAALRFAIRAFVSEGHGPGEVLIRLAGMLDVGRDGHFATVLCGVLDPITRTFTAANAGHLPPLVVGTGRSRYLDIPTGPPIGVPSVSAYQEVTLDLPAEGTLLTFTDGLVEQPGETLDASLERLRSASDGATSLAEVFDHVVPESSAEHRDDIAILGVQWPT